MLNYLPVNFIVNYVIDNTRNYSYYKVTTAT